MKIRWRPVVGWAVSLFAAAVYLMPIIWVLLASVRPEGSIFHASFAGMFRLADFTLENYPQAWRRAQLSIGLTNSLLQVGGIVLGGLVVNSMAAYAFARLEFPGRDILFVAVVIMIILPVEALAVPLFLCARDLGLTGSRWGALAALILPFTARAFNIFFLRQHFLSLPRELEESAIIDGAGHFALFWKVALPSIRPALATVVVLDALTHWGIFIWPLMVATRGESRTVQLSLANLFTQPPIQWGDIMACAVIVTLPVVLLFVFCQKHIAATSYESGVK